MALPADDVTVSGTEASLTVLIYPSDQGGFTAECVEIPGCFSEGETQQEADANIRKAISACLSVMFEDFLAKVGAEGHRTKPNFDHALRTERITLKTQHILTEAATA